MVDEKKKELIHQWEANETIPYKWDFNGVKIIDIGKNDKKEPVVYYQQSNNRPQRGKIFQDEKFGDYFLVDGRKKYFGQFDIDKDETLILTEQETVASLRNKLSKYPDQTLVGIGMDSDPTMIGVAPSKDHKMIYLW